jgi:diacylglycerol O-acyltransferase
VVAAPGPPRSASNVPGIGFHRGRGPSALAGCVPLVYPDLVAVQLRGIDAAFLALESRTGHLHGVGVVRLVPGAPHLDLDQLIALVARRLPRLDVLHRRLVNVPGGLDRPYWIDVEPDLRRHIRSHRLPADGAGAFERFCADLAARPIDRSAPMWEFWLVDGLPGEGQALLIKLHHSLSDGIGSLALVAQLFDQEPDTADGREDPSETWPEESSPSRPWLLGRAALHALRRPFELVATSIELARSAGRVRAAVDAVTGTELAAPLATPRLPFHGPITDRRSVAFRDLPLDHVKAIAKASGTHVNDVLLTVLAGTLRTWLDARDELPDQPLVAAVPVSTRGPDELFEPGNYVSACFVHLPTNLADPRERLAVTAAVSTGGKAVHAAVGDATLERLTSLAYPLVLSVPASLYQRSGAAALHPAPVNLVVSNVAGPSFDLFIAGRPAEAFYALGPIFDGVSLNVTAISFRNVLGFGYLACPDLIDDLAVLADGQQAALEELAEAYGV